MECGKIIKSVFSGTAESCLHIGSPTSPYILSVVEAMPDLEVTNTASPLDIDLDIDYDVIVVPAFSDHFSTSVYQQCTDFIEDKRRI